MPRNNEAAAGIDPHLVVASMRPRRNAAEQQPLRRACNNAEPKTIFERSHLWDGKRLRYKQIMPLVMVKNPDFQRAAAFRALPCTGRITGALETGRQKNYTITGLRSMGWKSFPKLTTLGSTACTSPTSINTT